MATLKAKVEIAYEALPGFRIGEPLTEAAAKHCGLDASAGWVVHEVAHSKDRGGGFATAVSLQRLVVRRRSP